MIDADYISYQPIEGVPVEIHIYNEDYFTYVPLAPPFITKRVSENESFAIYKASKYGKLTVKTQGSGDTRTDPMVTFEEITESEALSYVSGE